MTTWTLPTLDLLDAALPASGVDGIAAASVTIADTLEALGLPVTVRRAEVGPVVTRYEIEPAPGTRVSRIRLVAPDLAVALAAPSVRVEVPIAGRHALGVEVPNARPAVVTLRQAAIGPAASTLTIPLGADVAGTIRSGDLAGMPHLLIAGATGSGKSVMVNAILSSLLLRTSPAELRLLLVDMKRVELAAYHDIPQLLGPVITEPADAKTALGWLVAEMERRYALLAGAEVRNLEAYNTGHERLPYIVVVVDELADLVMRGKGLEVPLTRLAQKARATGIHLILATQRPSVNVVTGTIKANFPARIAFAMTSNVDSRTILDSAGAEDLVGRGDMLYQPATAPHPIRLQGVYVSDREINALADHWRAQGPAPDVIPYRPVRINATVPTAPIELGTGSKIFLAVMRQLFN